MIDLLNELFIQNKYKKISLNIPGIFLNVKNAADSTLAIVTIDETNGNIYTREQFENISRQIRSFVLNENCTRYRFLYIIISDDDNCIKRLLHNDVSYWRIVPSAKRLMVFETSCDDFLILRKPIENILIQNPDATTTKQSVYSTSGSDDNTSIFDKEINIKPAIANISIVIFNVIIFIIMSLLSTPGSDDISDKLALDWNLVINHGEIYRLVTCMFVHAGIDHIYNNMIVLLFIGSYFELAIGHLDYIIVYFSSGIIAGLTSMVYNMSNNNHVQSVGASGAIFGIIGGMTAVILIKYFHNHNLDLKKIIFIAFLSLYGGFSSQGVDNAAHVGGFVSGFLISFIIYLIHLKREKRNHSKQSLNL
ncbi:rhomboid family intramembrane serine protease [Eubacterium sp. MSJ-13]|uniref:rhomboid family intramembrane serine protease n=1 Tax=Eubacterium sp. MSJ-13 TaxID=2841513 RepID=UPI001C12458D|nr:rhomboid family intramembrane serine protease [Eubacterium sp. MSJ-13]MBU5479497.1 rhomboid family intramembrane serine protease [Eubacterium sp. MSJ-13]